MLKPYYFQANEYAEPEFIGWASNWDNALDLIDTSRIHEMSVIDEIDYNLYNSIKKYGGDYENGFDDDVMKELEKYFAITEVSLQNAQN